MIGLAEPAVLAIATGFAALCRPGCEFFSMAALVVSMRPIFGGEFSRLIHVGEKRNLSDAEQSYIFPPNRRPETRGWLAEPRAAPADDLGQDGLRYLWMIAIIFWGSRLMGMPASSSSFWLGFVVTYGVQMLLTIGGALAALGAGYLIWETYHSVRSGPRRGATPSACGARAGSAPRT